MSCPEKLDYNLAKLDKKCYHVYEEDKCCAVRTECPKPEGTDQKVCQLNGENYFVGQQMYPKEDNCLVCHCNEKWQNADGINNPSCKKINCGFQVEKRLKNGCAPVYADGRCCPVDYYCREYRKQF